MDNTQNNPLKLVQITRRTAGMWSVAGHSLDRLLTFLGVTLAGAVSWGEFADDDERIGHAYVRTSSGATFTAYGSDSHVEGFELPDGSWWGEWWCVVVPESLLIAVGQKPTGDFAQIDEIAEVAEIVKAD